MTLVMVVGVGIRAPAGWVNDCCCTVILPPEAAAKVCIWLATHAVAAPMPRAGSLWLDNVCRVPNETSFSMVAWIRFGSIWLISFRNAGSGGGVTFAELVTAARAEPVRRGMVAAVAAVAADAERKARRVAPR